MRPGQSRRHERQIAFDVLPHGAELRTAVLRDPEFRAGRKERRLHGYQMHLGAGSAGQGDRGRECLLGQRGPVERYQDPLDCGMCFHGVLLASQAALGSVKER